MHTCSICGEGYIPRTSDALDCCLWCFPNLAATLEAKVRLGVPYVEEEMVCRLLAQHDEDARHGAV
jgi:hypothetical protein